MEIYSQVWFNKGYINRRYYGCKMINMEAIQDFDDYYIDGNKEQRVNYVKLRKKMERVDAWGSSRNSFSV